MILGLQFFLACVGLAINIWTLVDTIQTARILAASRTNGVRWTLVVGDLVDEWLRLSLHICILVPALLVWGAITPNVYVWGQWRTVVVIVMTLLLVGQSVNRWKGRVLLVRSLEEARKHDE